jgi:hypothetical protein
LVIDGVFAGRLERYLFGDLRRRRSAYKLRKPRQPDADRRWIVVHDVIYPGLRR